MLSCTCDVGKMYLGWYESKAGKYEDGALHLQSALAMLQDTLPTSHIAAECKINFVSFLCSHCHCLWAGHYFLAFTFLKMKDMTQADIQVRECLRLQKFIFPVGHAETIAGRRIVTHSSYLLSSHYVP